VLGCDRLDHGYNLLADDGMVARAATPDCSSTPPITSVRTNIARRHTSIARMRELGLKVTLNTDDPQMLRRHRPFVRVLFETHNWGKEAASRSAARRGKLAAESARADLRREFERQITALEIE